jgi:hypothetical protein
VLRSLLVTVTRKLSVVFVRFRAKRCQGGGPVLDFSLKDTATINGYLKEQISNFIG